MSMEVRQETLDALGEGFVEDVSRFVVPIFTDIDGAPVAIGTGVLIDTKIAHVLVTAAHVLDEAYNGRSFYLYVGPNVKRAIEGRTLFSRLPSSGSRDDDLVDTAVVILKGNPAELPPFDAIGKQSLPLSRVFTQGSPRQGKRYAFLGFPASKSKTDRVGKNVVSASYAYLGSSVSSEVYTELGLEQEFFVVLPFHKRDVFSLDGVKINFPSLQGMSGSPLWELNADSDGRRCVVGIMIRDKSKRDHVVIAADIWFALKMVSDHSQPPGSTHPFEGD